MRVYKKWFVRSHQFSILRNMTFYYMLKLFLKVQTVQIKMQEWYVDSMKKPSPVHNRTKIFKKKIHFPLLSLYLDFTQDLSFEEEPQILSKYVQCVKPSNVIFKGDSEILYRQTHLTVQYFITRCPFDIGLLSDLQHRLTVRFQTL